MTEQLFYQEPVALDRLEHRHLCLKRKDSLDFVKNVNSVPIAGIEFFEVSRDFPVLFMQNPRDGSFTPAAILALNDKGHLLEDKWGDVYMPAFIRRYPFALSKDGSVMIDLKAPHLQEDDGEYLFNDNGENTEALDNIIRFLHESDNQFTRTQPFVGALVEQDLLTQYKTQIQIDDKKLVNLGNTFIINEDKLKQLSDSVVTEWFKNGWLAWCYAQLHSLGSIQRLAKREYEATHQQNDSNR